MALAGSSYFTNSSVAGDFKHDADVSSILIELDWMNMNNKYMIQQPYCSMFLEFINAVYVLIFHNQIVVS